MKRYVPSQFNFCAECGRPKWANGGGQVCWRCYRRNSSIPDRQQKTKVLDALGEFADTSLEIAEMTGLRIEIVSHHLRQLELAGAVTRTKRWRWHPKCRRRIQCWRLGRVPDIAQEAPA